MKVIEIPDEPEKSPGMESKDESLSTRGKEEKQPEAVSTESSKEKEAEEEKTLAKEKEVPDQVKGEESDAKSNDGKEVY